MPLWLGFRELTSRDGDPEVGETALVLTHVARPPAFGRSPRAPECVEALVECVDALTRLRITDAADRKP